MIKKQFGIGMLALAILLAGIIFAPTVSAQEALDVVSVEKAEKVAFYSIKEISESISDFSEWNNATVKLSTIYYDLEYKKSAGFGI